MVMNFLRKKMDAWNVRDLYTHEKKLVQVSKIASPNAKFTKSVIRVMKLGYNLFTRIIESFPSERIESSGYESQIQ